MGLEWDRGMPFGNMLLLSVGMGLISFEFACLCWVLERSDLHCNHDCRDCLLFSCRLLLMKDDKLLLLLACDDENSLFACNVMYLIE